VVVTSEVELDVLGTVVGVEVVELLDVGALLDVVELEVVELLELVVADEALFDEHAPRHSAANATTNTAAA
jgi:hypothetical protein